jgi:uncharacterized protein DUF1236
VRKTKLLSTVAMTLLLSAGAASAQGMGKEPPERAPAAQQTAPAEKVAPSMKAGEQKSPQTTGQAAPDSKATGKGPETTGQSPKSEAPGKAGTTEKDKSGATGKSDVRSKSEQDGAASKPAQSTTEQNRSNTTGQGAASGSAKLSTEQRTKVTTIFKEHKVEQTKLNVSVSVGTRIPTSVHLYPVPVQVIEVYPAWRGFNYILVGAQIIIVDPRTHEIVAILDA